MWRAVTATCARQRSDVLVASHRRRNIGAAPRGRDGVALSLSLAIVMDAPARADLLAGRAAVRVGLSAILHCPEFRILCASERRIHRRRADVGHALSRPAWLLRLLSRGDVVAQSRQ